MTTDPQTAIDQLDHLHRITLPDLRRQIEYHQDGKARWRKRAKAAEARVAELELAAVPVAAPPVAVDSSEDRCAECGHFRGAHEEAEEPVSVGRCTVCADEDEWHGFEESPVAAPPTTEQGDLRDRIRRAVCEAEGFGFAWGTDMLEPDEYGEVADMVLAVLFGPIPAGTDVATWTAIRAIQLMNEAGQQRDAVLPAPADRAAGWLDAAAECNKAGGAYAERGATDAASAAFALMEAFLRKAGEAEYVATPCDFVACEPGGEPCSVHERLMTHAEGDHELCAPDCGSEWQRRLAVEVEATEPQPDAQGGCPTPLTHSWGCGCRTDEHPAALGTLPAWLHQRFTPSGVAWDNLDGDEQSYWEHQARAVRRAVQRGGFKEQTPAAAAPAVSSRPGTEQEA